MEEKEISQTAEPVKGLVIAVQIGSSLKLPLVMTRTAGASGSARSRW